MTIIRLQVSRHRIPAGPALGRGTAVRLIIVGVLSLGACGGDDDGSAVPLPDGAVAADGGAPVDGGPGAPDGGPVVDGGAVTVDGSGPLDGGGGGRDAGTPGSRSLSLDFASFLGGSGGEFIRDVALDPAGNIYLVGGTSSADFPVTAGAAQGTYGGGPTDVVVIKLTPSGVQWATYLGGPGAGDEYAYGAEVDSAGDLVITGRAAPSFPVTPGAFQSMFRGHANGSHGQQNSFVAKFSPAGALRFATYFGTGTANRDVALASDDSIILTHRYDPMAGQAALPASWFSGRYRTSPVGGRDAVIVKMSADGGRVLWATYLGGSGDELPSSSVRVDGSDNIYLVTITTSTDAPTTAGAHDRSLAGPNDSYVAKLSSDGTRLIYGTYVGGSGVDWGANIHNLAVDSAGRAIIFGETTSTDFPVTAGAFQRTYAGAATGAWERTSDYFVAKLSADGSRLDAATYLGGSGGDRVAEGIAVDAAGNVYFSGGTFSSDFPVSSDAFSPTLSGPHDGVIVMLPPDMSSLRYATYMGGVSGTSNGGGNFRACVVDASGNLVVAGTAASDWPQRSPIQTFGGGGSDIFVARFAPIVR